MRRRNHKTQPTRCTCSAVLARVPGPVCWELNVCQCGAGKGALKVAAESAKDAAAGKDDEQSPRRADSAGKRPAKCGGPPSKQVRPKRASLATDLQGHCAASLRTPAHAPLGLNLLILDSIKLSILSCSVLAVFTGGH